MRRLGRWGYRAALAVLPAWLRDRVGADMLRTFDERQGDTLGRAGRLAPLALLVLWLREIADLARTAYRSRRPDAWARRTSASELTSRHGPTMDHLRTDLRFALRTFVRRPGMSLLALVTLGLGIGSSTAMFSVVDSVLLRPLPYPEPDRIVRVYPTWPELVGHPTLGDLALRGTWSWPEFWLVAEQQEVFDGIGGYYGTEVTLDRDGARPERIAAGMASRDLFTVLGAQVHVGRLFGDEDGGEGSATALLSYDAWQSLYASDPDVLGRSIRINDRPRTIVGVLAKGFSVVGVDALVWLPVRGRSTDDGLGNHGGTRAVARLGPGVGMDRARDEVARILGTLPKEHGRHGANVFSFQSELTRRAKPVLLVMLAASGLLLVVACGNVAALLLGAGIDRERELAVRGAVGATRGRLAQQLLTESVLLTLAASLGGIGLAKLTTRVLALLAPPDVPRLAQASVDGTVLAFAVGLAVACGVVFGLIPAMSLSHTELARAIGSTRTTGGRRARLQSLVVVGELALATLLLVGATLLGRTVLALGAVDPGFDAERLIAVSIAFPYSRFDTGDAAADAAAANAYRIRLAEALEGLAGVEGVESSSSPPFFGWRANNDVLPEGWPDDRTAPIAERRFVGGGYFAFMHIPLAEGRDFDRSDDREDAEPVVIVSRGLAELAWPGESALGRSLGYWGRTARVVGVAEDVNDEGLEGSTSLAFYAPSAAGAGAGAPFLIRTAGDPAAMVAGIRDRIWSVDPDVPITRVATMREMMSDNISDQVFRARLMGVFAALAGAFALLGVYGVTSRSVARRTREMGLRVALGAGRGSVRGLVTKEALRLAALGAVAGLAASVAVGGVLQSFLWGVGRTDPLTLALVGGGLILFAVLAALPPALRATRVDPLEALRTE